MLSAFITGLGGPELSAREAALLKEARPCGVILFARNAVAPDQVRRLTAAVKAAVGCEDVLILIDQEGGRVQRLGPPRWRRLPPAAAYGNLYRKDPEKALRAAWLAARLTGEELRALGINTNCAPVLDVPVPGSHDIIGDRAYGMTPELVAALGRAVAEGTMAAGVLPVVKHMPGHGRAKADSHCALPIVTASRAELERSDFEPFRRLNRMPAAMTAHVLFADIDPDAPASTSAHVISEIVRGAIGFGGLLMSDDIGMGALSGPIAARAAAVVRAGCDVALHCSGLAAEIEEVAGVVPPLTGASWARFERAVRAFRHLEPFDVVEAEASLAEIVRASA
jgi:beta-N-acetylhexosaminidase